jgi:hypothetical protein
MIILNNKNKNKIESDLFISLLCILLLIVFISLSGENRLLFSNILSTDISILIFIVVVSIVSYSNIMIGFYLSVLYMLLLIPHLSSKFMVNNKDNSKEGFTTNKNDAFNELINNFMGKGKRTKKILKDVDDLERRKNRQEVFNNIDLDNLNNKKEKFNNNNEKEIVKRRKFDPNDEFDNNLLLTMDICDDIKKRIKYEYESIPYLQKYISSRLQEIIDLLELTK